MARRKTSAPRAGLGRVEDRGATPEPAPEAAPSPAGSLRSDWEEDAAHRRVRPRHVPPHLKEYAVTLHVGAGEWELGSLPWSLGDTGDVALRGVSTPAVLQPLVDSSAQEGDSTTARFPHVKLRLPDEQTLVVFAPSDEAASSLHVLLRTETGHLAWDANTLTLCLSSLALSQQATHAEEWTQRQWQKSLLMVLAEFCPGALKMDVAELAAQEEAQGRSPPRSPRASAPASPPFPEPPLSPPARQQHNHAAEIARVYRLTAPTGLEPAYEGIVPGLVPTLRGYQRRALQWMLGREHGWHAERVKKEEGDDEKERASTGPQLHVLWRELSMRRSSAPLYINAYTGLLSERAFPAPSPVRGGILADEMGLGKTVELLALILAHRYQGPPPLFSRPAIAAEERVECPCGALAEDGAFAGLWVQCESCLAWAHAPCVGFRAASAEASWACARCLAARAEVRSSRPCGATLVVCPAAIAEQWADEARRHVDADSVQIRYFGGQGGGAHGGEVVTAEDLARCDVVVTTYDVLRRDVHRVGREEETEEEGKGRNDIESGVSLSRSRRRPQKYSTPATPLTRLVWWRVCLDEAQTVEGASSAAAELASRLCCTHRWCVSGTPLARGVEDAGGLLRFLRVAPWDDRRWWSRCVAGPLSVAEDGGGRGHDQRELGEDQRELGEDQRELREEQRELGEEQRELGEDHRDPGQDQRYLRQQHSPRNRALSLVVSMLRPPAGLLWRSSKRAVAAELALPPQSSHTHALSFSALERLFYAKQHAECVAKARAALSSRVLEAALREA
ncbi:SNF2 family domain-containing protein, partial [Helicosporidium sp. ATCC 50920]